MANGRRWWCALPLLAVLLLSACTSRVRGGPAEAAGDGPRVHVVNNYRESVNVYLVQRSIRIRLGVVSGQSQETYNAPGAVIDDASDIQLLAHPLGSSENYLSSPILLRPGLVIELRLESTLSMSSVHVQ